MKVRITEPGGWVDPTTENMLAPGEIVDGSVARRAMAKGVAERWGPAERGRWAEKHLSKVGCIVPLEQSEV